MHEIGTFITQKMMSPAGGQKSPDRARLSEG